MRGWSTFSFSYEALLASSKRLHHRPSAYGICPAVEVDGGADFRIKNVGKRQSKTSHYAGIFSRNSADCCVSGLGEEFGSRWVLFFSSMAVALIDLRLTYVRHRSQPRQFVRCPGC